jgi:hypothetical protein
MIKMEERIRSITLPSKKVCLIKTVPRPVRKEETYKVYEYREGDQAERLLVISLVREYVKDGERRAFSYNIWGAGLDEQDVNVLLYSILAVIKEEFNVSKVSYIDLVIWRKKLD